MRDRPRIIVSERRKHKFYLDQPAERSGNAMPRGSK